MSTIDDSFKPWSSNDGFGLVEVLNRSVVDTARDLINPMVSSMEKGFLALSVTGSRSDAVRYDRLIRELVWPHLTVHLPGYEPVFATLLIKSAGGGVLEMHQDWTFTDERCDRSVVVWLSLDDVTGQEGTLRVIPGSHTWTTGVRASNYPLPTAPYETELTRMSRSIPVRAGHAIIYDPALIHGSSSNSSDRPRRAIGVLAIPSGSVLLHVRSVDPTERAYIVRRDFFTASPYAEPPVESPSFTPWADRVSSEDIASAITEYRN